MEPMLSLSLCYPSEHGTIASGRVHLTCSLQHPSPRHPAAERYRQCTPTVQHPEPFPVAGFSWVSPSPSLRVVLMPSPTIHFETAHGASKCRTLEHLYLAWQYALATLYSCCTMYADCSGIFLRGGAVGDFFDGAAHRVSISVSADSD